MFQTNIVPVMIKCHATQKIPILITQTLMITRFDSVARYEIPLV